jgi:hypothetical protein
MNTLPPHVVAAMDQLLRAIGRWQANPTLETWTQKLAAIRAYLAMADEWDHPQYTPAAP